MAFATSGATGYVGGRVAARLAEAGVDQRLIVRDRGRAPELAGAEAAEASYADPEALREALAGARIFFMVSAAEDPDRLRQHKEAVDATVDAGVERIMYLSSRTKVKAASGAAPRNHYHTQQHIRATGLGFIFLRDNWYQDMLPVMTGADGSSGDRRTRGAWARSRATTWRMRPSRTCSTAPSTTDVPTT